MAKMTISIPDDLRAEIEKLPWVNWSKVSANAFADTILKARAMDHSFGGLKALRAEDAKIDSG